MVSEKWIFFNFFFLYINFRKHNWPSSHVAFPKWLENLNTKINDDNSPSNISANFGKCEKNDQMWKVTDTDDDTTDNKDEHKVMTILHHNLWPSWADKSTRVLHLLVIEQSRMLHFYHKLEDSKQPYLSTILFQCL